MTAKRFTWYFLPIVIAVSASAQTALDQDGCPAVSFSSAPSAALAASPSTHRLLSKQSDGSYTAFDMTNASPYSVLHSIPHFEKQLRPCVPGSTGLNSLPVLAVAQTGSGGYILATPSPDADTNLEAGITVLDSALNLIGQTSVSGAAGVVFADVNGDGILDIVSTGPLNQVQQAVSVSLGNGGASFQPPVTYPIPAMYITPAAVADVNGDHKLDLVVAADYPSAILVLLGNGDGTFQQPSIVAPAVEPEAVGIADLNGDGKPDLVFLDSGAVSVALGVGGGTFMTPVKFPVGGTGAEAPSIAIGDLNGDGIPDIVTGGATILFGDGKGGFPRRSDVFLESPDNQSQGNLIITDFNGDGIADIVAAVGTASVMMGDTVSVLFGRGAGTFAGPPVSVIPDLPNIDYHQLNAIASADLNADGIPDFVTADQSGDVSVLKGAGDGAFQPVFSFTFAVGSPTRIAFGDFNRDGNLDFAVTGGSLQAGVVEILLGKGDGTFQPPVESSVPVGVLSLAVGDFDGDGKLDLALLVSQRAFAATDSVQILLGNGDGSFTRGAVYPVGPVAASIAVGAFHNNSKLDLVVADIGTISRSGNLLLLSGNGDGTFAAPVPISDGSPNDPFNVITADFNRDGKLDLALGISVGLDILLGNGDGSFQTPVGYAVDASTIFTGDLNGDGVPDLVTSGLRYLLGNGDGTFNPPVPVSAGADTLYTPVAVADFNHDGKLDVAAGALAGIAVFLNTSQPPSPATIVSAASLAPGPLAPDSIVTAFGNNLPSDPSVSIEDSAGTILSASILYSGASQINFYIPAGLDAGPASVTIGSVSIPVVLASIAPSLFIANTDGLAAAYVTYVSAAGKLTNQPVFSMQNGVATPIPIDVSAAAGQAYLILFGTGLRNAPAGQILLNGGGFSATYTGPQPTVPGLDQINIPLPSIYAGDVEIRFDVTIGALAANSVYIVFK